MAAVCAPAVATQDVACSVRVPAAVNTTNVAACTPVFTFYHQTRVCDRCRFSGRSCCGKWYTQYHVENCDVF